MAPHPVTVCKPFDEAMNELERLRGGSRRLRDMRLSFLGRVEKPDAAGDIVREHRNAAWASSNPHRGVPDPMSSARQHHRA
jgi:hypothetical protein